MVYFTKTAQKSGKKERFCNALHAKTVKAALLKFSVRIPVTTKELQKKTG
jgi:hypothetical protein